MKRRDLVRFLEQLGAEFKEGGKHTKVFLNNKQTTIPRHTEIDDRLVKGIKKQLGIES
ncbi:type II toxin-antitoxin system HicA family toxin [Acinetobacter sp. ME22]|uniref:type II toxin-antitoxin system HicA family toxin n=1 Tax=Acinetobacter sp. ME22 TaxID=2904802 RepID=UPI001EDC285B|nr:type II toxin-antitoxin system HicA family toxin [Acinetobacter sp. ME22]